MYQENTGGAARGAGDGMSLLSNLLAGYRCGEVTTSRSIYCDACKRWYHKKCENLSDDEFKKLSNAKRGKYLCIDCEKDGLLTVKQFEKMLVAIRDENSAIRDENSRMHTKIDELTTMVTTVVAKLLDQNETMGKNLDSIEKKNESIVKNIMKQNETRKGEQASYADKLKEKNTIILRAGEDGQTEKQKKETVSIVLGKV